MNREQAEKKARELFREGGSFKEHTGHIADLLMREAELEGMLKYEEIKKAHKRGLHHPREHRYNYYLNLEQQLSASQKRVEELEKDIKQIHKDYGCELRDPWGTIWEQCDRVQKENEALKQSQGKRVEELEKVKITMRAELDSVGKVVSEYKAEISTLKQENKELKEDRDSETRWAKQYRDELYALKEELDRATENNDELINREQELINCYKENIKLDVGEWEKGLKEYKEGGVK